MLHHEAGLVFAIGTQKSHAYPPEGHQSHAFGRECGALLTHEPCPDPHVGMQPIPDDLALRNTLEEQSLTYT